MHIINIWKLLSNEDKKLPSVQVALKEATECFEYRDIKAETERSGCEALEGIKSQAEIENQKEISYMMGGR